MEKEEGQHVVLETERLILRGLRESDLEDFHEYASRPYVAHRTGYEPHKDLVESKFIMQKFIDRPTYWALELKEYSKMIGSVEIMRNKPDDAEVLGDYEIGYTMNEKFHGRGLMTEAMTAVLKYAFNSMELPALSLVFCEENKESKRVAEKAGFKHEGELPYQKTWKYDNKSYNFLVYSMTKEDWQQNMDEAQTIKIVLETDSVQAPNNLAMEMNDVN